MTPSLHRRIWRRMVATVAITVLVTGCVTTTHQTIETLPENPQERRIVLLSPDVELSHLHAGGITELNAEWTREANSHLRKALHDKFTGMNASFIDGIKIDADTTDDPEEVQIVKLHGAVGGAILQHQYVQPLQLPSKAGKFQWSLGPDAAYLKSKYEADYGLFVYVRDSYATGGRVAVMVFAALLGVGIPGGTQIGFASLVDLDTGEVVWFNRLARTTGDLRTGQGGAETVGVLLANFPE